MLQVLWCCGRRRCSGARQRHHSRHRRKLELAHGSKRSRAHTAHLPFFALFTAFGCFPLSRLRLPPHPSHVFKVDPNTQTAAAPGSAFIDTPRALRLSCGSAGSTFVISEGNACVTSHTAGPCPPPPLPPPRCCFCRRFASSKRAVALWLGCLFQLHSAR
jgi:hypothetical protein